MKKFGKKQNKNHFERKLEEILILTIIWFHYVKMREEN